MNMLATPRRFAPIPTEKLYDLLAAAPFMVWYVFGLFANVSKLYHKLHDTAAHSWQLLAIVDLLSTMAVSLFAGLMIWMLATRRPAIAKTPGIFPRVAALLGTYLCVAFVLLPRQSGDLPLQLVSLLFVLVGEAIAFCSLLWLGRSFSLMAEARHLVTDGPYAFVRHPLYVGEQIAVFGILLQILSPLAVAVYALQFAFQFVRMGNEERILRQIYPEYEAYGAKTARVIPGIY